MITVFFQWAISAIRFDRLAFVSAEKDELMMQFSPAFARKVLHQFFFDRQDIIIRVSDLQTFGDSCDMRIYGKCRYIETVV